ncbi:MAG: diguanylate cyclase [Candidatus Wallbacteria bacterium]
MRLPFYKNLKLYQKITVVIFAMVLLTAIPLYIGYDYIFKESFEFSINKRLTETLGVIHNVIEDYHGRARTAVGIISFNRDFCEAVASENTAYISEYLQVIQNNLLLSIIEVFSKSGRLLTRIEGNNLQNSSYYTSSDHKILKDAITRLRKSCDVEFSNSALQIKAIIPVLNQTSFEPNGAVIVTYPINHYFADLLKCTTNTDVLIFNEYGEIMASTLLNDSGQRATHNIIYQSENKQIESSCLPDFIFNHSQGGLKQKYATIRFENNLYAAGFSPIYKSDGRIAGIISCALPLARLYETRNKYASFLNYLLLVIVMMVFAISYIFSRGLTGPLNILTQKAQLAKSGDIESFDIPVSTRDEIGTLTDAFNQMTFSLKITMSELQNSNKLLDQRLFELQILFDISQSINFVADTHELLGKILQKTIQAVSAHHASIMLLNDTTDELEVSLVQGIASHKISEANEIKESDAAPEDAKSRVNAKIRADIGIAGAAFKAGKPLLINDTQNDSRFYKKPESEYPINSIICVPLFSNNKPYGIINVVNKESGKAFTDTDLCIATSIANQVSLILEKVKLYEQSITDGMTKLYIHRYFQARLDEEIVRARRYKSSLTLIMLDVDHFKSFNDTYGHQMGDVVLIGVAEVIKSVIRSNLDIPARYGGEEFAVILPETDIEGAVRLAERIRYEIEKKEFKHSNKTVHVTASLGIASYPIHSVSKLDLIAKADLALYKSKQNGRNRVSIYDKNETER